MIYIGIDPGKSGGIVAIGDDDREVVAVRMPATDADLFATLKPYGARDTDLRDWAERLDPEGKAHGILTLLAGHPIYKERVPLGPQAHALIERVHAMPRQGVSSAFTFGRGLGALHMALAASRIPFEEVNPAVWMRAMGCLTKGDKNITKRRAQALFPYLTVTHAIADALLIAEYCRRLHRGHDGKEDSRAQDNTEARREEGAGQARLSARPRSSRPAVAGIARHGAGS